MADFNNGGIELDVSGTSSVSEYVLFTTGNDLNWYQVLVTCEKMDTNLHSPGNSASASLGLKGSRYGSYHDIGQTPYVSDGEGYSIPAPGVQFDVNFITFLDPNTEFRVRVDVASGFASSYRFKLKVVAL